LKTSRALKLALLIVETSSIPLYVVITAYILTGYQILFKEVRLIPKAEVIHADPLLRTSLIILTYLHSISGLNILINRRVKNKALKTLLEYIALIATTTLLAIPLTLELVRFTR